MGFQIQIQSDLPGASYPLKYFDLTAFFDRSEKGTKFWIGRNSDANLIIDDKEISRRHCYIEQMPDGKLKLVDNGSRNGFYVNKIKVTETILKDGDSIVLGPFEMILQGKDEPVIVIEKGTRSLTPTVERSEIRIQKTANPNTPLIALAIAFIIVMVVSAWYFVLRNQDNKTRVKPIAGRENTKPVISSTAQATTAPVATPKEPVSQTDNASKFLSPEDLARKTLEEYERQKQALKAQREKEEKEYQARLKAEKDKEEAAKRQQEAEQRNADEQIRWGELKIKILAHLSKYQYPKALDLTDEFFKDAKTQSIKTDASDYLDDLKGEYSFFQSMLKNVSDSPSHKKIMVDKRAVWVMKADENGFEGSIAGLSGSVYTRQWVDIAPAVVLELFPTEPAKTERFYLATFCYNHNLLKEGERILVSCLKLSPDEKLRIDRFLARYKDIALPEGGFCEYKGRLVTVEEKTQIEARDKVEKEDRERKIAELKKQIAPKGVISKPGADKEKLSWEQARITETAHYIVQTNLSVEALNDICYVMECFYIEARSIFKVTQEPQEKLKIYVFKEGKEYYERGGYGNGIFFGDGLMTFYQPSNNPKSHNTTSILLHEGTHQFISMVCNTNVPAWLNEGMATYYEASKFEGTFLKTNLINYGRLPMIQDMIKKKDVPRLEDLINIRQMNFSLFDYAHVWSLVYFFMNYNHGQYAENFAKYFEAIKATGYEDRVQHKELFEEAFGVKLEVLEKEWEEYIGQLR
jgi:pSer/pThr/pTyr-binding forkhead associated (FHA) protein